jgi:hypothetical protein
MRKIKDAIAHDFESNSDWHDGWFVWDEFYSDLNDMVDDYIYDLDENMSFDNCLDILPNKAYAANRKYIKLLSLNKLITKIARCYNRSTTYHDCDYYAQEIWETAINDLWFGCDDEFDCEPNGIDKLQNAIDKFATKNQLIYQLFGKFKWFTPILSSCGKKSLKKALDNFENENRHFWVYNQSDEFIELTAKFWKFWIDSR